MAYHKVNKALVMKTEGPNFRYKAINPIKRDNTEANHFKDSTVEHILWSPQQASGKRNWNQF